MKFSRRQCLNLAGGAVALPYVSRFAWAQAYPTRAVRWVVPFGPGGVGDILTRLMGQWLSERLGQPFITENRPGAGGNIGTEIVVRAPPDGYTLLTTAAFNAINATLYDKLNFNFTRDIAPVASIMRTPSVMEVNPSLPAKTVPEFIAFAKANPGKISMATAGIGSGIHIYGELFNIMAGIKLVPVHYRSSGPALTDLIGGQVQVMFDTLPSSIEQIRAGQLRPLAVTTAMRLDVLPHVPTIDEILPGYEASAINGVGVPIGTPEEIINTLNKEINAGLADPKIKARLADLGGTVLGGSPVDFGRRIAEETEKWRRVIRAANIKLQ